MRYYINNVGEVTLPTRGKADTLSLLGYTELSSHDAANHLMKELYEKAPSTVVCVVENGLFDAVGYAYSAQEFHEFNDPLDRRRKRWFLIPNAAELSGYNDKEAL